MLESKILGTALTYEKAAGAMLEVILAPEVFTTEINRGYFEAIRSVFNSEKAYDTTIVVNRAKKSLKSIPENEVVSASFDFMNYAEAPSVMNTLCYELISDFVRRSINEFGVQLSASAKDFGVDPPALLDRATEGISRIEKLIGGEEIESISDQVDGTVSQMRKAAENTGLIGHETGLSSLDSMTGGWQKGHLITIAGRPGMGKSALALKSIVHNCIRGVPCLLFSREMTSSEVIKRAHCITDGTFNMSELFTHGLNKAQTAQFEKEVQFIKEWPLFIDEKSADLTQIVFEIKRFNRMHPNGIVFIDYLQLMKGSTGRKYDGDTSMLTDITRTLKQTAKACDIPIIELSQLNREVDKRPNKMPNISDLKQSGSIEEDSNLIIFCYRPEVYGTIETFEDGEPVEGLADLLIAKNRSGRIGFTRVEYQGVRVKFSDRSSVQPEVNNEMPF